MHAIELDQILLFGDSLTQLADAYVRKLDVVNRGFSGYNTDWCRLLLPSVLATIRPTPRVRIRLVTVLLGANDAADAVIKAQQSRSSDTARTSTPCWPCCARSCPTPGWS
nr:hypothetical protein HK105_006849 [Polyrhizophydium stewartii]